MGKSTINGHFQYVSIAMLNYQRVSKTALIHYHGVLCLTSAQTANRATSSRRLGCPQAPAQGQEFIKVIGQTLDPREGTHCPSEPVPKWGIPSGSLRCHQMWLETPGLWLGKSSINGGSIGIGNDVQANRDFRLQDLWCADPLGNIVTAAQFKFN